MKQTLVLTLAIAALCLPGPSGAGEMTFHSVVDGTKAGLGPGLDGLYGTADDVDNDLSEFGLNPNGSISYIFLNELSGPLPQLILFGEGTLGFDALPPSLPAFIDDFELEVMDSSSGSVLLDLPDEQPRALLYFGNGFFFFTYTAAQCGAGETRETCEAAFELDISGNGWIWQPGIDDPADLPFVNETGFAAPFVPFLEYVESVVPADTTMISVASTEVTRMTEFNTRGALAELAIGGTFYILNVQYSTHPVPTEVSCPRKSKLCGAALQLAGGSEMKVKNAEAIEAELTLPIVLARKNWAGMDSRGYFNYGRYKEAKKGRKATLKYDLGDLGFIVNALTGVIFPDAKPETSKLVVKLNKKRSKVKRAEMNAKIAGERDEAPVKVKYSLDLAGPVELQ